MQTEDTVPIFNNLVSANFKNRIVYITFFFFFKIATVGAKRDERGLGGQGDCSGIRNAGTPKGLVQCPETGVNKL